MREDANRAVRTSDSRPQRLPALGQALLQRLFEESHASRWDLTRHAFSEALERSASKRFASGSISYGQLEEYLGTLHLEDLALACACAQGCEAAWNHFVTSYRSYLYSAAAAITRRPPSDPYARELADSLYATLFSRQTTLGPISLFNHFHGRSKLSTWLRAVLAQRYVDVLRQEKRFQGLDDEESCATNLSPQQNAGWQPDDPNRAHYLQLLTNALRRAIHSLDSLDRARLILYYMKELSLAEIGRAMNEHEATVSRKLERIRQDLKQKVINILRAGSPPANGRSAQPGLDDAQIQLCFEYATQAWPFDLSHLLDFIPPAPGVTESPPRGGLQGK